MPFAAPSKFKGASGILRDVDATIVGLEITDVNPLAGRGTPKPGAKKSDFHTLFGVLKVRVDGAETVSDQPLFIGDADVFVPTEDGMGVSGEGQLSKSSGWFIFLDSLEKAGFDMDNFPEDPEGIVADYSALVGARVRFNWQKNEKATKKYGQKLGKKVDPKTGKPVAYDREDLIVTNYYGQADVDEPVVAAKKSGVGKTQPAGQAKPLGAKKGAKVDVAKVAADNIILALNAAKDKRASKSKVSVKLLTQLGTESPELRTEVRAWADDNNNLASIEGVTFDPASEMLSLDAD